MEQLLDLCLSLLLQVNAKGETPLHAAAKCGDLAIVEARHAGKGSADARRAGKRRGWIWSYVQADAEDDGQ